VGGGGVDGITHPLPDSEPGGQEGSILHLSSAYNICINGKYCLSVCFVSQKFGITDAH
jgi:hypothetical protein